MVVQERSLRPLLSRKQASRAPPLDCRAGGPAGVWRADDPVPAHCRSCGVGEWRRPGSHAALHGLSVDSGPGAAQGRRPLSLAGHAGRLSRRAAAAQQGVALPARSAHRRGDPRRNVRQPGDRVHCVPGPTASKPPLSRNKGGNKLGTNCVLAWPWLSARVASRSAYLQAIPRWILNAGLIETLSSKPRVAGSSPARGAPRKALGSQFTPRASTRV
jgi:hypothetical protein